MNLLETYDLEEALSEASDEQREQFAHLWGMTGEIYNTMADYLQQVIDRLEVPVCARFVWEYLPPDERQIFYHSMSYSARDGLRRDALQTKSQIPPERFEPAVNHLIHCCLLYQKMEEMDAAQRGHSSHLPRDLRTEEGRKRKVVPVVYPFEDYLDTLYTIGREIFTPLGDRSTKSLAEILTNLDEELLYDIYQSYNVKWGKYRTRTDFVAMIVNTLAKLKEPLDHITDFDERARDLYLWLRQQGGRANMQDVRLHTGLNDPDLSDVLYELESAALAFDTLTRQDRVLFIPHDMFARLKHVQNYLPEPEVSLEVPVVAEDFVPPAIRHSEPVILYDMAFVVNAISQQTIEPTQVGRVPKRIATKIRAQLRGLVRPDFQYDDNYLEMLLDIAKENRLVRLSKSPLSDIKDHYEVGEQLAWWSQLDIIGQSAYLLHHWKGSYRWDDLEGVHYRAWDPYAWKPMSGRAILLKYLSRYKPGRWHTVASLLQGIWDEDPFAMHPQQPYTRKAEHRKTEDVRDKWEKCDGETYIGMLTSTLHELGIVDLGYDRPDALETKTQLNPQAFMLTEFGASVLPQIGNNPPHVDGIVRALIVQPNFELLILQPDMPALYSVLSFAQLNQVGMVSRLTLNRATLLRAMEAGRNVEQVIKILEERSQKELPQNVVYSLNDWARLYKGVRLSQVILFEVSSEALATELSTAPRFKDLGLRQLAPCIFAVNSDINLKQLKQNLEKEGIAVQISGNVITPQNRYSATFDMLR